MQDWSIGVLVLAVVALATLFRLPWRRARSIRVESRIATAAVDFDPLPPEPPHDAQREPRAATGAAPELRAASPRAGEATARPRARAAARRARRASPRKRKRRAR
jgi:hypothetical protein